jgi:hypothetical protein
MARKLKSSSVHGLLRAPGHSKGLGQRTLPTPRPKASPTCVDRRFQSDGHPFVSVKQSHLPVIAPSKNVAISHFRPKWERKSGARRQYDESLKRWCPHVRAHMGVSAPPSSRLTAVPLGGDRSEHRDDPTSSERRQRCDSASGQRGRRREVGW